MSRTDEEFKHYVCESLRELRDEQSRTKEVIDMVAEIVKLGRGMFLFASRVSSALRWIGGVTAGGVLIWHLFAEYLKGVFR